MLNADVHLILLRPTKVPVVGEAVSLGFNGQVELDGWSWTFHNEEEKKRSEAIAKDIEDKGSQIDKKAKIAASGDLEIELAKIRFERQKAALRAEGNKLLKDVDAGKLKPEELKSRLEGLDSQIDSAQDTFDSVYAEMKGEAKKLRARNAEEFQKKISAIQEEQRKAAQKASEDAQDAQLQSRIDEANRNKNFQFTFSKRVDISTTQMLNSMKAGDVFPTGTLSITQRGPDVATWSSLVFNLLNVRLLDYDLSCSVDDKMTTMQEAWTCEFASIGYVYKSKGMVYLESASTSQTISRAAIQSPAGVVRAFTMKNTLKVLKG